MPQTSSSNRFLTALVNGGNSLPLFWLLLALPAFPFLIEIIRAERYYPELMYETGILSVQMFTAALLITPLRWLTARFPRIVTIVLWLQKRRRAMGIAAFGYAALHLYFYLRYTADLGEILPEMLDPDIATGWIALALMALAAAISNNISQRRLGRNWKRLQRLVYPAALLVALHWWLIGNFLDDLWFYATLLIVFQLLRGVWMARRGKT